MRLPMQMSALSKSIYRWVRYAHSAPCDSLLLTVLRFILSRAPSSFSSFSVPFPVFLPVSFRSLAPVRSSVPFLRPHRCSLTRGRSSRSLFPRNWDIGRKGSLSLARSHERPLRHSLSRDAMRDARLAAHSPFNFMQRVSRSRFATRASGRGRPRCFRVCIVRTSREPAVNRIT